MADVIGVYQKLVDVLIKPSETIAEVKDSPAREGAISVLAGTLVWAIILFVISAALGGAVFGLAPVAGTAMMASGLMAAVMVLVSSLVGWLIGGVIIGFIGSVISKKHGTTDLLGGLGYIHGAITLAIGVLMLLPVVGWLLAGLLWLYELFLVYLLLTAKGHEPGQAILTIIASIICIVILGVLAAIALTIPTLYMRPL